MTRTEYIAKLTKYLRNYHKGTMKRPSNISWNILKEAGPENEAQVIAELGYT